MQWLLKSVNYIHFIHFFRGSSLDQNNPFWKCLNNINLQHEATNRSRIKPKVSLNFPNPFFSLTVTIPIVFYHFKLLCGNSLYFFYKNLKLWKVRLLYKYEIWSFYNLITIIIDPKVLLPFPAEIEFSVCPKQDICIYKYLFC